MDGMRAKHVLDETVYLDLGATFDDPLVQRLVDGLREMRPVVDGWADLHGDGVTMAALITLAANMAIDCGREDVVADVFRQNAEMLDVESTIGPIAGRA